MKLCLIFSLMAFGFNVSAEVDKELAFRQINNELLYSIRDADIAIQRAQSGLPMSQVELCSAVASGLNSTVIAFFTGLRELKKVKVTNEWSVSEFLTLDNFGDEVSVTTVSIAHIEEKLKTFSRENCRQNLKEYKKFKN